MSDGKIIATGYSNIGGATAFTLVRYNSNGIVDTTFGKKGITTSTINNSTGNANYCSLLQTDGKIILGGDYYNGSSFAFAVLRYNANGSIDTMFGNKGAAYYSVGNASIKDNVGNAIGLQSDGKIILAGNSSNGSNSDFTIVRFNSNGSVDSSFGIKGACVTPIGSANDNCYSMAVQADDKIVLGGDIQDGTAFKFSITRFTRNGILDGTFAQNGIFIDSVGTNDDDYGYSVSIQKDKKIILGGTAKYNGVYRFALLRVDSSGKVDNLFGSGGMAFGNFSSTIASTDYGRAMAIQPDGKILLAGRTYLNGSEFGLLRFNSNGSLDGYFRRFR